MNKINKIIGIIFMLLILVTIGSALVVATAPRAPILVTPANGATNTAVDLSLSVTVEDVDLDNLTVTFYYYNGTAYETLYEEYNVTSSSTVSYTTDGGVTYPSFIAGTYYLWYVNGSDATITNTSLVVWNFTTSDAPTITMNSPANNYEIDQTTVSEISLTLSTTVNDTNADNMTVIIYDASDDSVLTTEIITGGQGTVTYLWEELEDDETYTWYVTASDAASTTTSPTRSFGVETTVNEGITGVKTLTFAAFALLAVLILVAMAMLIVTTIQNGANTDQIITMAIWAIGGAITIFVGYLIIASVANGLI